MYERTVAGGSFTDSASELLPAQLKSANAPELVENVK
jgi:hypothetical protein